MISVPLKPSLAGLAAATLLALVAPPALAHPHVFIDARLVVTFDDQGAVTQLRHAWTFDSFFSAWSVEGLDVDADGQITPAEMQELADTNLAGISEYGFYTYAGEGAESLTFVAVPPPSMDYTAGRVTLNFTVAPSEPYLMRHELEIGVYDPEYYVAITFAGTAAIELVNAPDGCQAALVPPRPLDPEVENRLYELGPDVMQLPADLAAAMRGSQGSVLITCPGGTTQADTALEAVTQVGQSRQSPFAAPPPEPGLPMPRDGLFGWIAEQQRVFYEALNAAMSVLKTDANAFWVLGGLSFLYGVVHAAGPGHGKIVISSYMLANERQVRQGVALSFVSAMLQSLVAIAFVVVVSGIFNLTAQARSDAVHWISVLSYLLILLLGLWLLVRHLFGLGHRHATAHNHGHEHAHDHSHEHSAEDHHDHAHVVRAEQTGGGWREQMAVVLAVGLRPCTGALVVLVFALSQDLLAAGIASVLLMGLGTALTVAALATLAVGAKGAARRIASVGGGHVAATTLWWLELAGALAVTAFGALFLIASF